MRKTDTPQQAGFRRTRRERELLQRIKNAVLAILPDAEVLLYGSRARGDARKDSDWDILILTDQPIDQHIEETLWQQIVDIELAVNEAIMAIIKNRQEWNSSISKISHFYKNVEKDAITI